MSQMLVQITAPGPGTPEVSRAFTVTGNISVQFSPGHGPLVSRSVSVQFGASGPVHTATFSTATSWSCTGAPAANVPPGATITLTVTASGSVRFFIVPGEPDFEDVSAVATLAVRIANPPPVVTIDAFPAEVTAAALPFAFTLSGSTSDPDNNVSAVSSALDTGAFAPVDNPSGNWSRWQKSFALGGGLHRFIVQANDLGGNQVRSQAFLTVHPPVAPADPGTESITSWTRLEPACRDADMGRSIGARLFDPLWLMARQWQMGEFQAADVGTPVQARLRATSALLSRCHLGVLPANTNAQAPAYDPRRMPLEAMVERRPMRAVNANDPSMLPLAVDAGLHFLRMLEQQVPSQSYHAALISNFALQGLPGTGAAIDEAAQRFAQTMAGRALDARVLAAFLRAGGAAALAQDPSLAVAAPDRAKLQQAATAWLAWYDGLFAEPAGVADDAWDPQRLEYAVSVSASFSAEPLDQVNLTASEIDDGRLDWSSFDCDFEVNMVSNNDHSFSSITETTVPAPVSFRGAPAVRFWEIEDSVLAYGLLPVGPTDLAQMMMIEYTSSYGNDWFVVPLELPVGSINQVNSLVVTDSFGVQSLLKPIGAPGMPGSNFSLWQHSWIRRAGSDIGQVTQRNLFFLPPAIGQVIESPAVEEVLFMRDEMASMAWAIERSIESPVERAFAYAAPAPVGADGPTPTAGALPRYLLSSTVPENWIPLLPVQQRVGGEVILRLRRGAVLQPDGSSKIHQAQSRTLRTGAPLLLYDEEVPREGVQLTRARRFARWIDGSSWVWTALRTEIGRGEGSSGLQFDQLAGQGGAPRR
jgi:hypothetical protein